MAYLLTIISIVLAYFSPADMIPSLAPYHIQQIILLPAFLTSFMSMSMRRASLPWPQYMLVLGFWGAVVMSVLSKFWLRNALNAFIAIALLAGIYFLVYINAFTLPRIRMVGLAMSICAVLMALMAIFAYHAGYWEAKLLNMKVEEGLIMYKRVSGLGVLHDPNDFAQFLLIGLAFLGFFWRKENSVASFILLCPAAMILVYATYLTFSRGALFGLAVILFVAISGRIGKVGSAFAAGVLFLFMLTMKFGGGREISLNEGSAAGRIVAWGSGIAQLRHSPLFGSGFGQFTEYNDLTAHNSFVLCFAELGLFGYFFWLGLIIVTVWGLEKLTRMPMNRDRSQLEYVRCLTTVRAALYGFLMTAWFLSRTYTETLYIILALAAVLIQMRRKEFPKMETAPNKWVPMTIAFQLASIVLVYVLVRLRSFG